MADRQDFSQAQRFSAFHFNALHLRDHSVDGIYIAEAYLDLQRAGLIFYCENCLFCHTDQSYFDVDHLVPDRMFRIWGKHHQSPAAVNMMILCKSRQRGDLGCNQSKGGRDCVPPHRGLAFTLANLDMNCYPIKDRPFIWTY
jgi:hypothetical protein